MTIKITWIEIGTNNAANFGLDETVEADSPEQAKVDAEYVAECQNIDLERFACVAEIVRG